MVDYYSVLGLKPDAFWFDIKRAYREKVKVVHPDRGGSDESFKIVQEAYECLGNQETRIKYDSAASPLDSGTNPTRKLFSLRPVHILEYQSVSLKYLRTVECECDGDKNCKYCEGKRIRSDEIDLKIPFSSYIRAQEITIPKGGDVDRYGRQNDLIVEFEYKFPKNMFYRNGFVEYNICITDLAFAEMISFTSDSISIYVNGWKQIEIPLSDIRENTFVINNLKINFDVRYSDLSHILSSNRKLFSELLMKRYN